MDGSDETAEALAALDEGVKNHIRTEVRRYAKDMDEEWDLLGALGLQQ